MSQAMKTKKIAERAKKKNPGKKDEKALSKKKKPGKVLGAAAEKDSDITECKREEEKLIILHKTYLGIMNSLTEAIYIQDENGVFLEVNKAAEKFYGYPKEYFIGKTLELISAPGKNDIPMIAEAVKKAFNGEPQSFEFWGLCKNGATFPASVNLTSGEYFGKKIVIATARDITERKHAEEEIKMLATALKRINECVSITDVENTILFVNEAFLKTYGYSEQELIGQNIKIVRPPNSPQEVFEEVLPGTLSGGWIGELVNRRKNGSELPIFLSTSIIEKKDGKANCLIGIAIDITERKRAELQIKEALETLKRSEENFRRSMDDSPLGVRVVTAKGETIYANKVLLDIYGYANMEELNKIPLKERYTPQSYAEFQIRKKDRERGDSGPSEYEINIVRKNKEIRHLLVLRKEVLWNGTKQFQVIYQDITERKQAESEREDALAALRESEEKFRKIFEEHAAVKLLIEPESGAIVDANKAAEQYYGWTRAELKRMYIHQINTLSAEQVNIEMEKVRKQKRNHFEFRHRRADGSIRDVEVFSSKIEMAGKDILHSIIHDITDRKRAESQREAALAALRESEARFRSLFENASIGIYRTTPAGKILMANPALIKMLGYSSFSELESRNLADGCYEPSYQRQQFLDKIAEHDEIIGLEVNWKRRDGSIFFVREVSHSVRDAQGVILYFDGTVEDITDRKQVEEERLAHLRFFESMDKVNRAVQGASNPEQMMSDVLDTVFAIFDCDRSWLLYPCDPDAPSFRVPMEITKPEYPGAKVLNVDVPMSPGEAQNIREALESDAPVIYIAGTDRPIMTAKQFGVQSQMFVSLHPKSGKPWVFGMHQCSYPRVWTQEEKRLFQEIGRRLSDALTSLLILRDLKESEEKYRGIFENVQDVYFETTIDGTILEVSPSIEIMSKGQYKRDNLVGKSMYNFYSITDGRQTALALLQERGSLLDYEIILKNRDGSHVPCSISAKIQFDANSKPLKIIGSMRDITDRKRAEDSIRSSLIEKEILLKEVHHRVKNNLMIIISLIKMQETKADNGMFNHLLKELDGRIRAMAQVHESLHKSEDLVHIDLQNYIETMSAHIRSQFGTARDIHFSVQAVGVDVNLDIAVPCGLILNELITNAYKHAFPGDKPRTGEDNCEIKVIVEQEGDVLTLTVADNGVGLPEGFDWEKSETLGLRLIKMLSKQINSSLELDRSSGTAFHLKFPLADKIH